MPPVSETVGYTNPLLATTPPLNTGNNAYNKAPSKTKSPFSTTPNPMISKANAMYNSYIPEEKPNPLNSGDRLENYSDQDSIQFIKQYLRKNNITNKLLKEIKENDTTKYINNITLMRIEKTYDQGDKFIVSNSLTHNPVIIIITVVGRGGVDKLANNDNIPVGLNVFYTYKTDKGVLKDLQSTLSSGGRRKLKRTRRNRRKNRASRRQRR